MDASMNVSQTMWSAMLPGGEIRSGTLEQLSEALQAGHLSAGTLVRAAGGNQWAPLAEVLQAMTGGVAAPPVHAPAPSVPAPAHASVPAPAAAAPPASVRVNGTSELWQVRLADGQVRSGTREQLEEAFHAGHLHEEMLVLAGGAPGWVKLGAVLGRGEPPPPAPVAAAPVASVRPAAAAPSMPTPPSSASGDEIWQVRLADGQVRSGTRLQLEEAFRAGHLDGDSLVLAAGASDWVPLYTLAAHLSSAPLPPSHAQPPPAPVVVPPVAPPPVEPPPEASAPVEPAPVAAPPAEPQIGRAHV